MDNLSQSQELEPAMKKKWTNPALIVHGKVEEITRQTKYKTWGGSDDVLVNNAPALSNLT